MCTTVISDEEGRPGSMEGVTVFLCSLKTAAASVNPASPTAKGGPGGIARRQPHILLVPRALALYCTLATQKGDLLPVMWTSGFSRDFSPTVLLKSHIVLFR